MKNLVFTAKNFILTCLITAAMALSIFSYNVFDRLHNSQQPTDPAQADAYMSDVKAMVLNKDGNFSFEITSPLMTHFPAGDITNIVTPNVTIFKEDKLHWFIKAESAVATQGVSQIIFNDKVDLEHPADQDNPLTTLLTDSLTVYPEKQLAETIKPIIFTQPDTIIHATGMQVDLTLGTIKLLSKATGEYGPHS